jgi:hypothetical protein
MTQTWIAEAAKRSDRITYEAVFCLACSRPHFICTATGRALGDNSEIPTALSGPTFPPKQIQLCHDRAANRFVDSVSSRPTSSRGDSDLQGDIDLQKVF